MFGIVRLALLDELGYIHYSGFAHLRICSFKICSDKHSTVECLPVQNAEDITYIGAIVISSSPVQGTFAIFIAYRYVVSTIFGT